MKKQLLGVFLGCMAISTLSARDRYLDNEQLKDLVGSYIYNSVVFYKGNSWFLPLKYFSFYAIPGAVFGGLSATGVSKDTSSATAAVMGMVTGISGLIGEYANRFNNVQIMNKYLKEYTSFENFKNLSNPQAAMLCAAHLKKIQAMKNIMPYLTEFLKDQGVWKVLTELYFDEPDSIVTTRGSSIKPGYSSRGGFSIEHVSQESVSIVKRAYMSKKTMKRRMKTLQAKLGYTE